ncbi:MAG: DNA internalization-related competence protein ComEC/Rec2 [Gammaproteobacteria bacterium]|nr:DNA internalization-related competence protein ComEC/Rec2 [Gammaproteobacteria bacterium]
MRISVLCFFAGILCFILLRAMPCIGWLYGFLCVVSVLLGCSINFKSRILFLLLIFATGFFYTLWRSHLLLAWQLPSTLESKNISVSGYIVSVPIVTPLQMNFLFLTDKIANQKIKTRIRLSWRDTQHHLRAGDHWQLTVRLKRIHSLMNPGGSDYEAWAFMSCVRAHGYVVTSQENILLKHEKRIAWLHQFRQKIKEQIELLLPSSKTSAWIIALAVGERTGIPAEQWEVLRNTGTNHLMAIAGLHIGFMSGFIFILVKLLWRWMPRVCFYVPAVHAAAIASLITGVSYAAISGFSLPARRACIMLCVFIFAMILRRKLPPWQAFFLALLFILILDPLSVLSVSFWLSMVSVFWITIGISGRIAPSGLWWKYGRIQWVITLGLIPLTVLLFQQYSIISLLANFISVPWMGFLILPFILLAFISLVISLKWAGIFFYCADKSLCMLWSILNFLSNLPYATIPHVSSSPWLIALGAFGILLLLLPSGFPNQRLGLFFLMTLLWPRYPFIPQGNLRFTVLDVGQGLATVLQTQHHLMVFDTGLRLSSDYDMGEIVLTPFLQTLHARVIDLLVLSHGDNDHAGGAGALVKHFSIAKIQSGEPERIHLKNVLPCLRGDVWDWDGVHFAFLSPLQDETQQGNDRSCVLKVTTRDHKSILLTGDIEKKTENFLLAQEENISADILIAPHHGSKTSGLMSFISAVHPRWVIFAVGYRNRFHFPNPIVLKRYQSIGTIPLATDQTGAIQFDLSQKELQPQFYRGMHKHFWND